MEQLWGFPSRAFLSSVFRSAFPRNKTRRLRMRQSLITLTPAILWLTAGLSWAGGAGSRPTLITPDTEAAIEKGLAHLARTQSPDGGWFYSPNSNNDEGSVTVTQIQGLRACREAGVWVPPESIRRACEYIQQCANPDGGIKYSKNSGGGSKPAITAAAVATMYNAGQFEHAVALGALEFVEDRFQQHNGDFAAAFGGQRNGSFSTTGNSALNVPRSTAASAVSTELPPAMRVLPSRWYAR